MRSPVIGGFLPETLNLAVPTRLLAAGPVHTQLELVCPSAAR